MSHHTRQFNGTGLPLEDALDPLKRCQLPYIPMVRGDRRRLFGQHGEQRAAQFLRNLGYVIVERNYRCPRGEIDLVAQDKGTIVFVEVRTHRSQEFGNPLASVNKRKQRQIAMTALHYLSRFRLHDHAARFDVIGIVGEGDTARLTHIKAAFEFPTSG